ncbi:MAG: bifunctional oligoribonuclease and phosphatase NrnA [Chloroflexota bacterium]|jgi:phosphoesterase RecJ-like protein|nr:bifunctional oligoribonuclease and phosphatase NrnA [Chloroflexota bacterium]
MRAEAAEILALVDGARRIVVISHKDADGDTLGSALAMAEMLRSRGKAVAMRVPPPVPGIYAFLPGYETINLEESGEPPDLVVVMDASNLERLSDTLGPLPEGTPVVNIDHHVSNSRFGTLNLVMPDASSTAEVTFDLLHEMAVEITSTMATNLYSGVLTDTGGFRHENTTFRVLEIAADLVKRGANAADIAGRIYKSQKLTSMRLQALTMSTIGFDCDDRLVYASVTQEMLRKSGARMDESEGLIDVLNSVEGLELALLFKEIDPFLTKISVRSRGAANANVLASAFGGGGHERASGAEIPMPIRQAMEVVLAEARRMLEITAST